MKRPRSLCSTASVLVALGAVVIASSTVGLHRGPQPVGPPALEPTTVYASEHRSQGNETHLHAEVGYESILCLACFSSLRNQTLLGGEPVAGAMSELGAFASAATAPVPASPPAHAFSSRAPPRR